MKCVIQYSNLQKQIKGCPLLQRYIAALLRKDIIVRGLKYSIVVGTILVIINHLDCCFVGDGSRGLFPASSVVTILISIAITNPAVFSPACFLGGTVLLLHDISLKAQSDLVVPSFLLQILRFGAHS